MSSHVPTGYSWYYHDCRNREITLTFTNGAAMDRCVPCTLSALALHTRGWAMIRSVEMR